MREVIFVSSLFFTIAASAAAPDWLRTVVSTPIPAYPAKTKAVVLLDERVITVKDSGEMRTNRRVAFRILRPDGRDYAVVGVSFDNDTRLTFFRGWSFPEGQPEYELKEKDAFETGYTGEVLYSDVRQKILIAPEAGPGSTAGFEYEQKNRPFVLQNVWDFQKSIPVRKARLILQLPPGWEFKTTWRNYAARRPSQSANQWTWELDDVAPLETEPYMPSRGVVAGQMALTFLANGAGRRNNQGNWPDVAAWFASLTASRLAATPDIARQTDEITAAASSSWKKLEALASFVQAQIRYVAIPIGISSHQPHAAAEILINRYGDCKDKATLLKTMLRLVGIDSYYVLVHSERGAVDPEFPSVLNFNHVILAIRQPEGSSRAAFSTIDHPSIGRLLLFDPTDPLTPLGALPDAEQSAYGLIVRDNGGELLHLPLHSSSACRLIRNGMMKLLADGSLSGKVEESRWGRFGTETKAAYRHAEGPSQTKILESFLSQSLGHYQLTAASVANLDGTGVLGISYSFTAWNYAKRAGDYLLVRPRLLGVKALPLGDNQARRYAVSLPSASVELDRFDIEIPAEYELNELPAAANVEYPFAKYTSKFEMQNRILHYERQYIIKQVEIPRESFGDLRKLQQIISADEQAYAVFRKKP